MLRIGRRLRCIAILALSYGISVRFMCVFRNAVEVTRLSIRVANHLNSCESSYEIADAKF